jgi:type IV secretory pathway VirD2 relaxase
MAIYIFNFSLTPNFCLSFIFPPHRKNNRNDGTIHITKEKPTQRLESRAVCEQINKQTVNETMMVVEQTTGWYELQIINKFYTEIFD